MKCLMDQPKRVETTVRQQECVGRVYGRTRCNAESLKRKDVESVGTLKSPPGRTVCSHFLLTIDYTEYSVHDKGLRTQ